MFNLKLSAEQREFRDTVRDFAARELKPHALNPDRLQQANPQIAPDLLARTASLGLRTLTLSEKSGGAGADSLTSCVVAEELAAGDAAIGSAVMRTAALARWLFEKTMTPAQKERWLPGFIEDERFHLAHAVYESEADRGWLYPSSDAAHEGAPAISAKKDGSAWVLDGATAFTPNACIAKLFAVEVPHQSKRVTLLVPADAPGLSVLNRDEAEAHPAGEPLYRWHDGAEGQLVFNACRIDADHVLRIRRSAAAPRRTWIPALNLGIGRAAYETALDYAKLRIQGGRPIVEHEAIGSLLAEMAIRLAAARSLVLQAAWAEDHPDGTALPIADIARVHTAEAVHQAALQAAEIFGAMGVMRDMPLQQYLHETLRFVHSDGGVSLAKLRIAHALATEPTSS
jgi:alkylation response protein AidB-like acyl-CoA dehydrogenase